MIRNPRSSSALYDLFSNSWLELWGSSLGPHSFTVKRLNIVFVQQVVCAGNSGDEGAGPAHGPEPPGVAL